MNKDKFPAHCQLKHGLMIYDLQSELSTEFDQLTDLCGELVDSLSKIEAAIRYSKNNLYKPEEVLNGTLAESQQALTKAKEAGFCGE